MLSCLCEQVYAHSSGYLLGPMLVLACCTHAYELKVLDEPNHIHSCTHATILPCLCTLTICMYANAPCS